MPLRDTWGVWADASCWALANHASCWVLANYRSSASRARAAGSKPARQHHSPVDKGWQPERGRRETWPRRCAAALHMPAPHGQAYRRRCGRGARGTGSVGQGVGEGRGHRVSRRRRRRGNTHHVLSGAHIDGPTFWAWRTGMGMQAWHRHPGLHWLRRTGGMPRQGLKDCSHVSPFHAPALGLAGPRRC